MGNQKSDVSQRLRDNGVCCERAECGADYFPIFNRCNLEWRQHTLRRFTQVA